jgi:hypothetical protein
MPRIDISKAFFDVAICHHEKPGLFVYAKFSNTKAGSVLNISI